MTVWRFTTFCFYALHTQMKDMTGMSRAMASTIAGQRIVAFPRTAVIASQYHWQPPREFNQPSRYPSFKINTQKYQKKEQFKFLSRCLGRSSIKNVVVACYTVASSSSVTSDKYLKEWILYMACFTDKRYQTRHMQTASSVLVVLHNR